MIDESRNYSKILNHIVKNSLKLIDNDIDFDKMEVNLYEKRVVKANKKIKKFYEKLSDDHKEIFKVCLLDLNKKLVVTNNYIDEHYDSCPFFYYSCNEYPKDTNEMPHICFCIICGDLFCNKCVYYSVFNDIDNENYIPDEISSY